MKKKMIAVLGLACLMLSGCSENKVESKPVEPTSDYYITSGDNTWEVNMETPTKIVVDDGWSVSAEDGYSIYEGDGKQIRTKTTDAGEVIYFAATTTEGDTSSRGLGIGSTYDELMAAYEESDFGEQPMWGNAKNDMGVDYNDFHVYEAESEGRQIAYMLKNNKIVMIQIAADQKPNASSFTWDFEK